MLSTVSSSELLLFLLHGLNFRPMIQQKHPFDFHNYDFQAGEVLLIDKPLHWTSFDVVKKLRYQLKVKKIGHAGTLDPLATGLLILCTGKMTKSIEQYQAQEKEYEGTLVLGKTTPSIDLETEFDSEVSIDHITPGKVEEIKTQFLGELDQIPPMHSAVKVKGQRVYKSARQGKTIELKPRKIIIHSLEFTSIQLPEVHFKVECSKGTYIRSLVRDVGSALGAGAYLQGLRRTRIGNFHVNQAYTLEKFLATINEAGL